MEFVEARNFSSTQDNKPEHVFFLNIPDAEFNAKNIKVSFPVMDAIFNILVYDFFDDFQICNWLKKWKWNKIILCENRISARSMRREKVRLQLRKMSTRDEDLELYRKLTSSLVNTQ